MDEAIGIVLMVGGVMLLLCCGAPALWSWWRHRKRAIPQDQWWGKR